MNDLGSSNIFLRILIHLCTKYHINHQPKSQVPLTSISSFDFEMWADTQGSYLHVLKNCNDTNWLLVYDKIIHKTYFFVLFTIFSIQENVCIKTMINI